MRTLLALALVLGGCDSAMMTADDGGSRDGATPPPDGGSRDGGARDGGGTADEDAGPIVPPPPPMATCTVPPEGRLVDTSTPTNVVGDGTPASCTEARLDAAVQGGGIVTFDCGPDPITVTLTRQIRINNIAGADRQGDTVIDGGGLVTLSGGGANRILYLNACEEPYNDPRCDIHPHPHLTVQRLTFIDGVASDHNGGGAIFRHGGRLTVIDSRFFRNRGPMTGQDTAGGAIRLEQATPGLIVGSTFGGPGMGNRCSNGGAIGTLQASITIINTVIDRSEATGMGGNPGNGGNGGGTYHDGVNITVQMCGTRITNSTGHAYGGGIFLVDNDGRGTVRIENSEVSDNAIPRTSGQPSHGGGAYLQGAVITIANSTFANNDAGFASGLFLNGMNGRGSVDMTNVTVADTPGDGMTVEGALLGTIRNSTVTGNRTGIRDGDALELTNTIVAGNDTNCTAQHASGGGSFQFPGQSCGASITTADPDLGPLQDNGGSTGVRTAAPMSGSPAIGAGNACPSTDARGEPRPTNGCTSGAHEAG